MSFAASAPTILSRSWPALKNWKVGIAETCAAAATSGMSSTSTLRNVAPVAFAVASSSKIGEIILHGPHQLAVKYTIEPASLLVAAVKVSSFPQTATRLVAIERRSTCDALGARRAADERAPTRVSIACVRGRLGHEKSHAADRAPCWTGPTHTMVNLVTLEVTLDNGGIDAAVDLVWASESGEEKKYAEIRQHATVRQESFAGHNWLVRGQRSRQVLLRMEAQAEPDVQQHRIDVDATPTQEQHEDADATAVAPAGNAEEAPEDACGEWGSRDGTCKFVRVPRRDGSTQATAWRELDADAREVGALRQIELRVDTRWLWWLESAYKRVASMSSEKEVRMHCLVRSSHAEG